MGVKWGILSTARINHSFVRAARQSHDNYVVAVASRDRDRADEYARANDIASAYGAYEDLLEDGDVDAVYISLPNSMHVPWSISALEAGKHVLCEKPLTRSAAEAARAFDAAERSDLLLSEAFMYRHNPQTMRLKELVEGGAIGPLRLIRASFSFTIEDQSNVRLAPHLDGGSLMDVGCYCVNAARYLAGEPSGAFGRQVTESGVDVVFAGLLSWPGDVVAQIDCGFRLPARSGLEVIGEAASLVVTEPWHCSAATIELSRAGGSERIAVELADSYLAQLDDFGDAIRGSGAPLLGREDATGQARTIEALYRSAEQGEPVAL